MRKLCLRNALLCTDTLDTYKKGMGRMAMGIGMYREAFPAIEAVVLERQLKRRRRLCEWTNEHGVKVGFLQVWEFTEDRLVVDHVFHGTPNVEASEEITTFQLTRADRGSYRGRPSIICPSCGLDYEKMFYVDHLWACYVCHDLTTVSRIVNRPVKWMRRYLDLKVLTSGGKAKGQHAATFRRMLDEMEILADRRYPGWEDTELHFMQIPQWPLSTHTVKQKVEPRDWGYGWTAGAEGGFQRLRWLHAQKGKPGHPALLRRARLISARLEKLAARKQAMVASPPRKRGLIKGIPLVDILRDDDDPGWSI